MRCGARVGGMERGKGDAGCSGGLGALHRTSSDSSLPFGITCRGWNGEKGWDGGWGWFLKEVGMERNLLAFAADDYFAGGGVLYLVGGVA